MKLKKGLFITFEGIEGSGKSTQIVQLTDFLTEGGYKVTVTREPGGTTFGEKIRKLLLSIQTHPLDPHAELFLYLASRTQHLEENILPALREGKIVVCDRYSDATVAYQGYGRGLGLGFVNKAVAFAAKGVQPDLTLLLDLDARRGLERVRGRSASGGMFNRLDREDIEFHRRVREGYLKIAKADSKRIKIINAASDIHSVSFFINKIIRGFLETRKLPIPAPSENTKRLNLKNSKQSSGI